MTVLIQNPSGLATHSLLTELRAEFFLLLCSRDLLPVGYATTLTFREMDRERAGELNPENDPPAPAEFLADPETEPEIYRTRDEYLEAILNGEVFTWSPLSDADSPTGNRFLDEFLANPVEFKNHHGPARDALLIGFVDARCPRLVPSILVPASLRSMFTYHQPQPLLEVARAADDEEQAGGRLAG